MGVRSSLTKLLTATALGGPARISFSNLVVGVNYKGPIRIGQANVITAFSRKGDIREGAFYIVSAQSVHRKILFTLFDSGSVIYGVSKFDVDFSLGVVPEHNPYRATIPETVIDTIGPEFYDYQKENQEILREQHDITQAGDTTFPYQMILSSHDEKHFTLGSISRFFHETYGLIRARYVQFDECVATPSAGCPVGLLRNAFGLEWVVTNRLDKSDPNLVVGVMAPIVTPTKGQYGWVIVDGPNLQPTGNLSDSIVLGESFAWAQTGFVSPTAEGKIIGRRVNKASQTQLQAGQLYVNLESFSKGDIQSQFDDYAGDLQASVTNLISQVNALVAANSAAGIATIQTTIQKLTAQLNLEAGARSSADGALNQRISNLDAVTLSQLNNALSNLQIYIDNQIGTVNGAVDSVRTIALKALNLANSVDASVIGTLESQISLILNALSILDGRAKGKFPVVDGSVPPNLVYLDDGSLVYTETF